jgi:hypothetical protein
MAENNIPTVDINVLKMAARVLHACTGSGFYIIADNKVRHVKILRSGITIANAEGGNSQRITSEDIVKLQKLLFDNEADGLDALADILIEEPMGEATKLQAKAFALRHPEEVVDVSHE